ncbi:hypothetical protein [Streptomyces sp. CAI-85]|uniref:hypothetical protein n=1 Tax=Streptomyces sp. CAI-85 TaxID=1472662 RepID=UPI0020CA46E4|nr:hypothetical protein [Streptomyces sp. CAI-85]
MRFAELYEAGDQWLADCSPRPDLVRTVWDVEALAPIACGPHWLAAETHLVTGMQMLNRIGEERRGPVLADPSLDRAWWLVPPAAAEELADVRSVLVHRTGHVLHCPPTGWHACGRFWLSRPDGTGLLTDPTVLTAALRLGGYRLPTEATP